MEELDFGRCLREEMQKRQIGVTQLEELTGVSESTVRKYRSGECSPRLVVAVDLLDALGLRLKIVEKAEAERVPVMEALKEMIREHRYAEELRIPMRQAVRIAAELERLALARKALDPEG